MPTTTATSGRILVVGDFIIDRTWLVTDLPLPKRIESHYDVIPSTLVNPKNQTDVAGGVGTIARCIAATSTLDVTVASGWGKDVVNPRDLFPPYDGMTDLDRIDFIKVGEAPFTTLKSRVFTSDPSGPALRGRYDRNLKPGDVAPVPYTLPEKKEVSAVIVADYDYGLLECGSVVKDLDAYAGLPFILRSPRKELVKALPWTLLAINLRHLATLLERIEPFDEPIVRHVGDRCIYHPHFVQALKDVPGKIPTKGRQLLVRISREDAVLVSANTVQPIKLSIAHDEPDGVGAGDVLLAQIALGILSGLDAHAATANAFAASAIFSAGARRLERIDDWYTPHFDLQYGKTSVSIVAKSEEQITDLSAREVKARTFNLLEEGPIRLDDAGWYLPGFLTVNPAFGKEIVSLKAQIKKYVDDYKEGSTRVRPFVAVLCGEPGAGKSTLARKMADVVGCEVVSESAAQWTTADDLFWLCERVRSIRMRKKFPLAFIDEVDTDVGGEKLYGKLLSPIWDGAYFIRGEERTIGPTVFILAGSTEHWRTRKELLKAASEPKTLGREEKLPDLVSRLSTSPINIPLLTERKEDVLYLAANSFVNRFPRVRWIARGILRLLANSECQHGVRSITRVAETFGPLLVDDRVMPSDLRPNRASELELHIPKPKDEKWYEDVEPVEIEV
jgi:hypothetical protein